MHMIYLNYPYKALKPIYLDFNTRVMGWFICFKHVYLYKDLL